MKLEGWIAVEKYGIGDWVADSSKKELIKAMEEQGEKYALEWADPVPCTITIPPSEEDRVLGQTKINATPDREAT